jgi:hypothetical protein
LEYYALLMVYLVVVQEHGWWCYFAPAHPCYQLVICDLMMLSRYSLDYQAPSPAPLTLCFCTALVLLQASQYRAQGQLVGSVSGGSFPTAALLSINAGANSASDSSDWAAAALLMYKTTLSAGQLSFVEDWLYSRYGGDATFKFPQTQQVSSCANPQPILNLSPANGSVIVGEGLTTSGRTADMDWVYASSPTPEVSYLLRGDYPVARTITVSTCTTGEWLLGGSMSR